MGFNSGFKGLTEIEIGKTANIIFNIILGIFFTEGIYTYIPETNRVPREHRVPAILVLLFTPE